MPLPRCQFNVIILHFHSLNEISDCQTLSSSHPFYFFVIEFVWTIFFVDFLRWNFWLKKIEETQKCPQKKNWHISIRIFITNGHTNWHSNCFSCCENVMCAQQRKRMNKKNRTRKKKRNGSKYSMSEKSNFSFYIANKIRYMTSDFSLHAAHSLSSVCPPVFFFRFV